MLTTVVGLLVAIPSGIGYNTLLGHIRTLSIELDGFTDELLGRLACEYQGRDS
jgi:biopolymer transport protein ExbB/TolQ